MPETLEKFGLGKIVFDQKVKEYKKYSLEDLKVFRSRLVENIETISKLLGISLDLTNIDGAIESVSKQLKELSVCSPDIVDRAREVLEVFRDLDDKDYDVLEKLLFFDYYGILPTTRMLLGYTGGGNPRSWIHRSIRDEISDEIGKPLRIYGKNIEYGLVSRTPLILMNGRYVRLNFLSKNFFKLFETMLEYEKCYESNIKRILLLDLKDLLNTLKAVDKAIESKSKSV